MQYEDYIKQVSGKLARDGFEVKTQVQIAQYTADIFGVSTTYDEKVAIPRYQGADILTGKGPYRFAFAIIYSPSVSDVTINDYSKKVYEFAFNKVSKYYLLSRFIFPVIASLSFSDGAKSFVSSFEERHVRWPMHHFNHPVIVELDTNRIFHNDKITLRFRTSNKIAKNAVEKYLALD